MRKSERVDRGLPAPLVALGGVCHYKFSLRCVHLRVYSPSDSYRLVLLATYRARNTLSLRLPIGVLVYFLHRPGGVRSLLSVEMPSWVLECSNCELKFTHSKIDDVGMLSYLLPLKPEFPPDGTELECPYCGYKATYQCLNLTYRA